MNIKQKGSISIVLITLIIIILLGGGWYFYSKNINSKTIPTNTSKPESETLSKDEVVVDSYGLDWYPYPQNKYSYGYTTWKVGNAFCTDMNAYMPTKSNRPWRLPTKNEMLNLYRNNDTASTLINKSANLSGYWTSDVFKNDSEMKIIVNNNLNMTKEGWGGNKNGNAFVLCVR